MPSARRTPYRRFPVTSSPPTSLAPLGRGTEGEGPAPTRSPDKAVPHRSRKRAADSAIAITRGRVHTYIARDSIRQKLQPTNRTSVEARLHQATVISRDVPAPAQMLCSAHVQLAEPACPTTSRWSNRYPSAKRIRRILVARPDLGKSSGAWHWRSGPAVQGTPSKLWRPCRHPAEGPARRLHVRSGGDAGRDGRGRSTRPIPCSPW